MIRETRGEDATRAFRAWFLEMAAHGTMLKSVYTSCAPQNVSLVRHVRSSNSSAGAMSPAAHSTVLQSRYMPPRRSRVIQRIDVSRLGSRASLAASKASVLAMYSACQST